MSDTIGARLRQARELRKLTLPQVSETTKLRIHYLQALETDDYSAIPSAAQARGFLRIYADFLGLDLTEAIPAVQPDVAPAVVDAAAAPTDARPARPNILAGLRERLGRRPAKDADAASLPTSLAPEAEEPSEASPAQAASSDTQTTRRTKAASDDVKKNAVR